MSRQTCKGQYTPTDAYRIRQKELTERAEERNSGRKREMENGRGGGCREREKIMNLRKLPAGADNLVWPWPERIWALAEYC